MKANSHVTEEFLNRLADFIFTDGEMDWFASGTHRTLRRENTNILEQTLSRTESIHRNLEEIGFSVAEEIGYPVIELSSPFFKAESVCFPDGSSYIVLHDGLFSAYTFSLDCAILLAGVQDRQWGLTDDELYSLGLGRRPTIGFLSRLYLTVLYNYIEKPFQLPLLPTRYLENEWTMRVSWLTIGAKIFIMLHEKAHIVLGHHDRQHGNTQVTIREETTIWGEIPNEIKEQEFDADMYAIQYAPEKFRAIVALSAIEFLFTLGMYESFSRTFRETHPLALNRIRNIIDNCETYLTSSNLSIAQERYNTLIEDFTRSNEANSETYDEDKRKYLLDDFGLISPDHAAYILLSVSSSIGRKFGPVNVPEGLQD